MKIRLEHIKNFAINNISTDFAYSKLSVILGPNGSGKTTLLHIIAGLIPYDGKIYLGNKDVTLEPTNKRNIAFIFQGQNLFPHLTVYENIIFPLKIRKIAFDAVKFNQIAHDLNIGDMLSSYPAMMSGGERQKVAIARTLLYNPDIILMDEPFTGLDLRTTKYMRNEIKYLQRKYNLTILFVTHNLYEAEELADVTYILNAGRLIERGSFNEIFFYRRRNVQEIFGKLNIYDVKKYEKIAEGLVRVYIGGTALIVPYEKESVRRIVIEPKDVYISRLLPAGPHINLKAGKVLKFYKTKYFDYFLVKIDDIFIWSEIPADVAGQLNLTEGTKVYLIVKLSRIKVL